MSAKIFISHSCKDLELKKSDRKNADKVTRWKRLNYACLAREKIVDGLGKPKKGGGLGYKVLLDKDRLEPGDDWRAKLHGWLGTCDGAVILLSEDSIQSDWLRKEATILTWRKSLRSELLLVPVFLGDLRSNALTECGLGCLHLADEEAARLAPDDDLPGDSWKVEDLTDRDRELHASCLSQKVLDKFNNLSSLNVPTHMEKWVRDVAGQLAQLADKKQHFLDEARRALRIHDKDWNDDEEYLQEHDLLGRTSMLANQLLTAPFDRVINAMNSLRQGMHREDFESLASRVACQWVDARAAQRLLPGTRPRKSKASDSRLLALNGNYVETASAYINRGYCCRLPLKGGMHLTPEAPTYSMRAHGGLPEDARGV